MNKNDIWMLLLLLELGLTSWQWMKAEKRVSYLEGRNSVAQAIQDAVSEVVEPYPTPERITRRHSHGK